MEFMVISNFLSTMIYAREACKQKVEATVNLLAYVETTRRAKQ